MLARIVCRTPTKTTGVFLCYLPGIPAVGNRILDDTTANIYEVHDVTMETHLYDVKEPSKADLPKATEDPLLIVYVTDVTVGR